MNAMDELGCFLLLLLFLSFIGSIFYIAMSDSGMSHDSAITVAIAVAVGGLIYILK
jgi:hypothetical protein